MSGVTGAGAGGDPAGMRDLGLQPERTALSWSRTAFAVAVNALLAVRAGLTGEDAPLLAAGVVLLVAAGAVVVFGSVRRARLAAGGPVAPVPSSVVVGVTLATLIACAAGVWSVLVGGIA
ncbi:MAG TPA: DUF202 domain-containing protein [Agromyces sp.]|nr:DUF202 domain-containing protein [Agromyces sp.]